MNGIHVPTQIEGFVRVLGEEAAIHLMLTCGGAPLALSEHPGAESMVVQAVGHEKAVALWVEFGNRIERMPISNLWIARVLRGRGESINAIARRLRVTNKTVWTWLRFDRVVEERRRVSRKSEQSCQMDLETWLGEQVTTSVIRK